MVVNLSPIWGAGAQLLDNSGNVLTGGKIYTYLAGTTTPAVTYTSSNGITANSNPIILNSAGRVPYEIWLTDSIEYKFVLKDSNDVLIGTWDNLVGINSNFINYYGQQEIQTATAGQTVFTLTEFQYEPGTGNLSVFVDGVNQYGPGAQYAYVETDASTITFVSGLHVGASVKFTTTKLENPGVADASQISYTYPDSNAVTENVEDRLAQYVSVKDFGAVGDGVTDDTAAVQNAIDYVSGLTEKPALSFPAGEYVTSSTLQFGYPGVKVFGAGRKNSIIKYTGNTIAVRFSDDHPNNTYAFGGQIEDIGIEGNANSSTLLAVKNVNHFIARNVNLAESSTSVGLGLGVYGTVAGYFENIVCSTNAQLMTSRPQNGIIVDRDPDSLNRATDNTFINCIIEGMVGDGIQLVNSDQSCFIGGTSENNTGNGVTIAAGSRMNTFISVGFENLGIYDVYDGGFSNRFVNCYSNKLFEASGSSLFCKVEGGFYQSITIAGDFATIQDLKYSFFGAGGAVTVTQNTSTRNLFNANTSGLTFNTKNAVTLTVGASPYTYTNDTGLDVEVIVQGGTVTQLVFERQGGAVLTLPTSGMFRLAPTDALVVSHSGAPNMSVIPFGTNYI